LVPESAGADGDSLARNISGRGADVPPRVRVDGTAAEVFGLTVSSSEFVTVGAVKQAMVVDVGTTLSREAQGGPVRRLRRPPWRSRLVGAAKRT